MQVAGEPLEAEDYRRWRERALRRGSVFSAPELAPGRYALVLFSFDPAAAGQFVRQRAAAHLTAPTVGPFVTGTEPAVALAGTLAAWIGPYGRPVMPAPPLLYTHGRWRVADLALDWPLPPPRADRALRAAEP